MAKISDVIELFIKELLKENGEQTIEIQRNELANYFNCVPSQINYVLTTRFTLNKGYRIESKRGGGGYIKIIKNDMDKNQYIRFLLEEVGDEISKMRGAQIITILWERAIISDREKNIMISVISDRSMNVPVNIKNKLRSNILKNMLLVIDKEE